MAVPTIATSVASGVTDTGAVCGGVISDDGGAALSFPTIYYDTVAGFTPELTAGKYVLLAGYGGMQEFTEDDFSIQLTDLLPGTRYYYRAAITNSEGIGYGGELSFTTPFAGTVGEYGTHGPRAMPGIVGQYGTHGPGRRR